MSYLPSEDAVPSISSAMSLFSSPSVDVSVKDSRYEPNYPIVPITPGSPIHFKFQATESNFVDLRNTLLEVKLKVVVNKEQAKEDDRLCYENGVLNALFQNVQVFMNDQMISNGNNLSAYTSMLSWELMTPLSTKKVRGSGVGYHHKEDNNLDSELQTATTKILHLVGRPSHEFFQIGQFLPPNVRIEVKLFPSPSKFLLRKMLDTSPDGEVVIQQCIMHVKKVNVIPSLGLAVERLRSQGNNVKLMFPKIMSMARNMSKGSLTFSENDVTPSNSLPSKLAVMMVKSSGQLGAFTENPYAFQLNNLQSLQLQINGQPAYTMNFSDSNYRLLYEMSMKCLGQDEQFFENGISYEKWIKGRGVMAFDISGGPDMSLVRSGQLRLDLTFSEALADATTLIVLGFYETVLEITPDNIPFMSIAP